jgi:hypothetical protein
MTTTTTAKETKLKTSEDSFVVKLKYKEFDFPEGVYRLSMCTTIVKGQSIIQISLTEKGSRISTVINYDVYKLMSRLYNVALETWYDLTSRRKLKTMQDAIISIAKRNKEYLI